MRFMLILVVLVVFVVRLIGEEVASFHLTNDARFVAALDRLMAAQPGPAAYPEQEYLWLFAVATAADRARRYDVAEAAMTDLTQRWPYIGQPWGNLSCYQGKQGKYAEALHSVAQAKERSNPDRQQLDGISAVWLWQLGKRDEATALLASLPQPKAGDKDRPMWLVCQAFFHASCDHDQAATKQAIESLLAMPEVGHWRYFFARDVAFDALRQEPWFIAQLGQTATGIASNTPFQPSAASPAAEALRHRPAHPEEVIARAEIAAACTHLENGAWKEAAAAADRALQQNQTGEAYVVKALALAGLDQAVPAMDAIRQISHQGLRLTSWPTDLRAVLPVTRKAIRRMISAAKAGNGTQRSVALGIIIDCHFVYAWRDYDEVIKMMDVAESWCPTLAEIPNTRALARIDKQDWAGAETDLRAAIQLNPDFADAHLNLAYLRREQGNPKEGMDLFEIAQRHGATYPGTELHGCLFLGAVGRFDEAEAIIRAAVAQPNPPRNLAGTCWELSSQYSEHQRFANAERLTRMVITLSPAWPDAWTKLSGDLARQGKFAEAAECSQRHLDSDPDAFDGKLSLAQWLVHLDRRDEAAAIVAQITPPPDTDRLSLYYSCKALYAASITNEAAVRESLTAAHNHSKDKTRLLRWLRSEPFLAAYRGLPWFAALVPTP